MKRSMKKMFRESSRLPQRYLNKNHLKSLRSSLLRAQDKYELYQKEIFFLLWAYDLEFWTLKYASEEYGMNQKKLGDRIVYPLMKEGYIHKYFDKLTPSQTREDHLFREETKFNYRVRYALTQKGRLMVQRFYRSLSPQ
jgi:hypothetical protein